MRTHPRTGRSSESRKTRFEFLIAVIYRHNFTIDYAAKVPARWLTKWRSFETPNRIVSSCGVAFLTIRASRISRRCLLPNNCLLADWWGSLHLTHPTSLISQFVISRSQTLAGQSDRQNDVRVALPMMVGFGPFGTICINGEGNANRPKTNAAQPMRQRRERSRPGDATWPMGRENTSRRRSAGNNKAATAAFGTPTIATPHEPRPQAPRRPRTGWPTRRRKGRTFPKVRPRGGGPARLKEEQCQPGGRQRAAPRQAGQIVHRPRYCR